MREITSQKITDAVSELCIESCCCLNPDVICRLESNLKTEKSEIGKKVLEQILENARIADREMLPICQDCGLAVVFADIGQEVYINGDFENAIHDGVKKGYAEGFLRKSTCSPLERVNFGDNTPAIIHTRLVPGDRIKLTVAPKGGGSENMSSLKMLTPAAGRKGIIDFVLETVKNAGPNPCPPIVLGIGIGGNFEMAPLLAKKALLLPIDESNDDPFYRDMEQEIMEKVKHTGIGPGGLGGSGTALAVHIIAAPCHIASLPCAVNINCHASRHKVKVL